MGKFTREKIIPVPCPYCSNGRLFDCKEESIIKMKCPQCKSISTIDLQCVIQGKRDKRYKAYQRINYELHNNN